MFQRPDRHDRNQIPPGKLLEQMFGQGSIFFIVVHSLLFHTLLDVIFYYSWRANSNSPTATKVINIMLIRVLMTVCMGSFPRCLNFTTKRADAPNL